MGEKGREVNIFSYVTKWGERRGEEGGGKPRGGG